MNLREGPFKKLKISEIIKPQVDDTPMLTFDRPRRISRRMVWSNSGLSQKKFKIELYRFLRDNIPLLNACIWTWSRLSSAPGRYDISGARNDGEKQSALDCLEQLSMRVYPYQFHKMGGLDSFLPLFFSSLYTDGAFAGFAIINPDSSGIERFAPIDPSFISYEDQSGKGGSLILETENGDYKIEGEDFYYFGLNADIKQGLGNSILGAVPFVAYIEQQLIDDMRRTTHNSGYNRLHVKITPPEKMAGESDESYVGRVNEYFDDTVSMIRDCEPEDNPVTWDNVKIEYIGPGNTKGSSNTWFFNHRAMVEEVCSGTNLAPFMLGYNYGTTHNWAQFKYDLVMRQVLSVQRQTARFLEWLGNMELALKGHNLKCRYFFDNMLTYLASDQSEIEKARVDNLIKLFSAGLISREQALVRAGELI